MSKILVYGGVAVLVVIAAVLGYQIYKQTRVSQTSVSQPSPQQTQDTTVPQTVVDQQPTRPKFPTNNSTTQSNESTPQLFSIPQSDWDKIVNYDSNKATKEEGIDFTNLVVKYAKDTNTLEFKQCKASPLIVTIKINSEFTIKSTDSKVQSIAFGSRQHPLASGASLKVKEDFAQTPGVYRYPCSYGSGNTGTYVPVAGVLRVTN